MTDARYPERWLNDRRVVRLSDAAHRLHVVALAWCVANRTDGAIEPADIELMPAVDVASAAELADAGLWHATAVGWKIRSYSDTQTTAAELDQQADARRKSADRQRRHRARDLTPDVTRDTTRTGQDRPGQASIGDQSGSGATPDDTVGRFTNCRDCGACWSSTSLAAAVVAIGALEAGLSRGAWPPPADSAEARERREAEGGPCGCDAGWLDAPGGRVRRCPICRPDGAPPRSFTAEEHARAIAAARRDATHELAADLGFATVVDLAAFVAAHQRTEVHA